MKKIITILLVVITHIGTFAQKPATIIEAVKKAQQNIKWVTYTMKRTDTLLTGDVRSMTGSVTMKTDRDDELLGFLFRAQLDGYNNENIYDGHMGYILNTDKKTYSLISPGNINRVLIGGGGGGWFVMPDLVKIDTTKAIGFNLSEDNSYYYLTMKYDEIILSSDEATKRSKILTINKKTLLPVAVRNHQEAYGKVQDLYYHINEIHVNDPAYSYGFSLPFLKDYKQEINTKAALSPVFTLKDKEAPVFTLNSFTNSATSLVAYKGKVVLLDFWEVWCGPCIESLPKVQHLYDAYKGKGLQVLGIINDLKQLEPSKQMVKNKKYTFPMLIGNAQLKKDYKLDGSVPLYILINKSGKINFIGRPDEIEMEINKAILE